MHISKKEKKRRRRNLKAADPTGWNWFTPVHWWRMVNGSRLDYWPSTGKFMFGGIVYQEDVQEFIRQKTGSGTDFNPYHCPHCGGIL